MYLYKRLGDTIRFLWKNPLLFAAYLPLALLSFINVSFDSTLSVVFAVLYMALLFILSSWVFSFLVVETYYHTHHKHSDFKHSFRTASSKFLTILAAEVLLIFMVSIFSTLMDYFAVAFTSNLGQAFTIVFFLAFLSLIVKVSLFIPSAVLRGKLGFVESWKLIGIKEFFEVLIFLVLYSVISYLISYLNPLVAHLGDFVNSIVLGPAIIIVLTLLYLDYLR